MRFPGAWACILVAAAAVAGCTGSTATFGVGGAFTEAATQAEMAELGGFVRQRGGDLALLESFPVQFRATGLSAPACEEVRAHAAARAYVASVGACAAAAPAAGDGDRPVANATARGDR